MRKMGLAVMFLAIHCAPLLGATCRFELMHPEAARAAFQTRLPHFPDSTPLTEAHKDLLAGVLDDEKTLSWIYQMPDLLSSYVQNAFPGMGLSQHDGAMLITWRDRGGRVSALKPLGVSDARAAEMIGDLSKQGVTFEAVPEAVARLVQAKDPALQPIEDPYHITYIHLAENLANLEGAKFKRKRNLVNQFTSRYPNYRFHDLRRSHELFPKIRELADRWATEKGDRSPADADDAKVEVESLKKALDRFDQLGLLGGAITVDGKVVAFTLGARKNRYTVAAIYEKADRKYKGAYQAINQMFAEKIVVADRYTYIDRQSNAAEHDEDAPDSAPAGPLQGTDIKMSYHPDRIVKWYRIEPAR